MPDHVRGHEDTKAHEAHEGARFGVIRCKLFFVSFFRLRAFVVSSVGSIAA